jgi:hypothetical protein
MLGRSPYRPEITVAVFVERPWVRGLAESIEDALEMEH